MEKDKKELFQTNYPGDVPEHIVQRRAEQADKSGFKKKAGKVVLTAAGVVSAGAIMAHSGGTEATPAQGGSDVVRIEGGQAGMQGERHYVAKEDLSQAQEQALNPPSAP